MTIIEFLEARIAEDEAVARAASHQKLAGPFHGNWRHDSLHLSSMEREDAKHIARHDPARVLAECAAKRAIIKQWDDVTLEDGVRDERDDIDEIHSGLIIALRDVIKALAAVYSSHPDYRQEWAL
jgi:hypothetical protein